MPALNGQFLEHQKIDVMLSIRPGCVEKRFCTMFSSIYLVYLVETDIFHMVCWLLYPGNQPCGENQPSVERDNKTLILILISK